MTTPVANQKTELDSVVKSPREVFQNDHAHTIADTYDPSNINNQDKLSTGMPGWMPDSIQKYGIAHFNQMALSDHSGNRVTKDDLSNYLRVFGDLLTDPERKITHSMIEHYDEICGCSRDEATDGISRGDLAEYANRQRAIRDEEKLANDAYKYMCAGRFDQFKDKDAGTLTGDSLGRQIDAANTSLSGLLAVPVADRDSGTWTQIEELQHRHDVAEYLSDNLGNMTSSVQWHKGATMEQLRDFVKTKNARHASDEYVDEKGNHADPDAGSGVFGGDDDGGGGGDFGTQDDVAKPVAVKDSDKSATAQRTSSESIDKPATPPSTDVPVDPQQLQEAFKTLSPELQHKLDAFSAQPHDENGKVLSLDEVSRQQVREALTAWETGQWKTLAKMGEPDSPYQQNANVRAALAGFLMSQGLEASWGGWEDWNRSTGTSVHGQLSVSPRGSADGICVDYDHSKQTGKETFTEEAVHLERGAGSTTDYEPGHYERNVKAIQDAENAAGRDADVVIIGPQPHKRPDPEASGRPAGQDQPEKQPPEKQPEKQATEKQAEKQPEKQPEKKDDGWAKYIGEWVTDKGGFAGESQCRAAMAEAANTGKELVVVVGSRDRPEALQTVASDLQLHDNRVYLYLDSGNVSADSELAKYVRETPPGTARGYHVFHNQPDDGNFRWQEQYEIPDFGRGGPVRFMAQAQQYENQNNAPSFQEYQNQPYRYQQWQPQPCQMQNYYSHRGLFRHRRW